MADSIDQYAVFGNPVEHSRSPEIHQLFAEQTGQCMHYGKQLVPLDGFEQAVHDFAALGGKGLNVTVPFKQTAFELVDELSPRAGRAGAVNTIVIRNHEQYFGDNTDGTGLVRDLTRNHGVLLKDKRILLLGAGGAVRGVLQALLAQRPQQLCIANRTVSKARLLAQNFADLGNVRGSGFEELAGTAFDVVINGTSASLSGDVPPLPNDILHGDTFCYDMMYAAEPTVFMQWAQQQAGVAVSDGLGMLVEQAAESFRIWRGVEPQTAAVIQAIRRSL